MNAESSGRMEEMRAGASSREWSFHLKSRLLPENQNDAWSLSLSVQPVPITEAAQRALL